MKKMIVRMNVNILVILFFALMLITSVAVGQEHLEIYGKVLTANNDLEQLDAVISDEYGEVMNIEVDQKGNFMLVVPANDIFTLRFSTLGTETRSLILDTTKLGKIKKQKDRTIELVVDLAAKRGEGLTEVTGVASFDDDGQVQFSYMDALP